MSTSEPGASANQRKVVVAMDKFRGSASATQMNDAVTKGLESNGWSVTTRLISDGGEGFRSCFEGEVVFISAPDAYGTLRSVPLTICQIHGERVGVLEVAEIVGYTKSDPTPEDALNASSRGVGVALLEAEKLNVSSVLLGLGGSSTSDGGLGCFEILKTNNFSLIITVATDITAVFSGAIRYAKQKGVIEGDLFKIEDRLKTLALFYKNECNVDVEQIQGAGAAGGIGGALAVLGAELRNGFSVIAEATEFDSLAQSADLVVTGEGRFDLGSLEGKVVSSICERSGSTPVLVLCGEYDKDAKDHFSRRFPQGRLISFTEQFGSSRSFESPEHCAEEIAKEQK